MGLWASLAPQLQVVNTVLEIKILKCPSSEAAERRLRYCLLPPRQPGSSQGCQVTLRSTLEEFPTWGLGLRNDIPAISRVSRGVFGTLCFRFLQKAP